MKSTYNQEIDRIGLLYGKLHNYIDADTKQNFKYNNKMYKIISDTEVEFVYGASSVDTSYTIPKKIKVNNKDYLVTSEHVAL
jgi:hypothetical protein